MNNVDQYKEYTNRALPVPGHQNLYPCPACGYCPTCGRRNAGPWFVPYYPYYPASPSPYWPTFSPLQIGDPPPGQGTIVWCSTTKESNA